MASNLFDPREAKRLYPLLGMGMVLGAAFGGEFTSRTALLVGTRNLMLASAVMVIFAYLCFSSGRLALPPFLFPARARPNLKNPISLSPPWFSDLGRVRHLQVIVAIMVVMYVVDTHGGIPVPGDRPRFPQRRPTWRLSSASFTACISTWRNSFSSYC